MATSELPVWIVLNSPNPNKCIKPPPVLPSIEYINVCHAKCSFTWLCSLLSMLLTLDQEVMCYLNDFQITSCVEVTGSTSSGSLQIKKTEKNISVSLRGNTSVLEAFQGLNINSLALYGCREDFRASYEESKFSATLSKIFSLRTNFIEENCQRNSKNGLLTTSLRECGGWEVKHVESLSQTLPLLTQLEILSITVEEDSHGLWEALHGLNIKRLSLIMLEVNHKESLSQSLLSLTQLEALSFKVDYDKPNMWEALHGLSIKSLSLHCSDGDFNLKNAESFSQSLSSLTQLESVSIYKSFKGTDITGLCEALRGLRIKTLSLSGWWIMKHTESFSQSLSSLKQLETLSISGWEGSPDFWEALRGLNIKSLSLLGVFEMKQSESLSQSLLSLRQLEELTLYVETYCALQFPQSLKFLNIFFVVLLPSQLRALVDVLAACTNKIETKLEFGCSSKSYSEERIPLQEYIPIKQEFDARNTIAVKRFRIYEWPDSGGVAMSTRDIDGADDASHDAVCDLYHKYVDYFDTFKINIISIRLQISPDSVS